MVRAVLDSSVLVSALITPRGTPGAVLDAAERRAFTLCLSPEILAETSRVLTRNPKLQARYGYDQAHVAQFCAGLAAWAQIETNSYPNSTAPCRSIRKTTLSWRLR